MAAKKKAAKGAEKKKSPEKAAPVKKPVVWDENACRAIMEELEKKRGPMFTRQIAGNITARLGIRVGKKTVNRYLYGILFPKVRRTEDNRWELNSGKPAAAKQEKMARPAKAVKAAKPAKVKIIKKKTVKVVVKKKVKKAR